MASRTNAMALALGVPVDERFEAEKTVKGR